MSGRDWDTMPPGSYVGGGSVRMMPLGPGLLDPVANVRAALAYMKARYGPGTGWQAWSGVFPVQARLRVLEAEMLSPRALSLLRTMRDATILDPLSPYVDVLLSAGTTDVWVAENALREIEARGIRVIRGHAGRARLA